MPSTLQRLLRFQTVWTANWWIPKKSLWGACPNAMQTAVPADSAGQEEALDRWNRCLALAVGGGASHLLHHSLVTVEEGAPAWLTVLLPTCLWHSRWNCAHGSSCRGAHQPVMQVVEVVVAAHPARMEVEEVRLSAPAARCPATDHHAAQAFRRAFAMGCGFGGVSPAPLKTASMRSLGCPASSKVDNRLLERSYHRHSLLQTTTVSTCFGVGRLCLRPHFEYHPLPDPHDDLVFYRLHPWPPCLSLSPFRRALSPCQHLCLCSCLFQHAPHGGRQLSAALTLCHLHPSRTPHPPCPHPHRCHHFHHLQSALAVASYPCQRCQ
mmetsp:Transcript_67481/g.126042  ORF Transcript_67481/g.126042 Transcript_67481/m.126042 type:complete len:323 (-) Transcript_67481:692-1660(-)